MDDVPADVVKTRLADVRLWMEKERLDAIAIGSRTNFAWLTFGGRGTFTSSTNRSDAVIIVSQDRTIVVAPHMDAERLSTEELGSTDYEMVAVPWYEKSVDDVVATILEEFANVNNDSTSPQLLDSLRATLHPLEMQRLENIGASCDRIMHEVATQELEPEVRDYEVQSRLARAFIADGFEVVHIMVGFDDRISRYRHPICIGETLGRYAFLHVAVRKYGLHGILTRSVHFGEPPADLARRYEACATIYSHCLRHSGTGGTYRDILHMQRQLYADLGFAAEWKRHHQGGPTGYMLFEPACISRPDDVVSPGTALVWFPTISGAKHEETVLAQASGGVSMTFPLKSPWPSMNSGTAAILIR